MIYNPIAYQKLVEDINVDAIIFTFRHHISSKNNPQMYGWVKTDGDNAIEVSVKAPISNDPYNDHAIVGTFYFRKVDFFKQALNSLLSKEVRVNGEYYVDSLMGELIELGLKVKVLEVEDYICWGTPNDYETFVYWQSFFHKCNWHPYDIERDLAVNTKKLKALNENYSSFKQNWK